ncbi:fas apoptotic inhibitory molecule 1 isoform 2-T2 [Pluvialis apricaria]
MTDLVAVWEVALSDGVHKIEFEHGTTSGKRVVYVDGKEEIRKEWMFKLVGKETFTVGAAKTKATINIDAVSGFAYEYTLEINGKSLKKYMENRSKTTNTWVLSLGGTDYRVVLEKDTMDVWCNGQKMETADALSHQRVIPVITTATRNPLDEYKSTVLLYLRIGLKDSQKVSSVISGRNILSWGIKTSALDGSQPFL